MSRWKKIPVFLLSTDQRVHSKPFSLEKNKQAHDVLTSHRAIDAITLGFDENEKNIFFLHANNQETWLADYMVNARSPEGILQRLDPALYRHALGRVMFLRKNTDADHDPRDYPFLYAIAHMHLTQRQKKALKIK